jgi:RNA polymerase sigma-70 factor (ECF subfamily)
MAISGMSRSNAASRQLPLAPRESQSEDARLVGLATEHFHFVWRMLRRLGVSAADADDGAQQVFIVVAKKLASINVGCERSFILGTTLRVAAGVRRKRDRRREMFDDEVLRQLADPAPAPDELAQLRHARDLLDSILDSMETDLASVFVLFEIEQLTMAEIAKLLQARPGTVASRLRRARADFQQRLKRLEAQTRFTGGPA